MKFLIVDNRSLFRHGLTALLKAKFDTATFDHAMDEEDAFLSLNRLSYTLIFISAKRDNIKTLCFIRQVTERWPNTKLITILAAKNIIAAPSIYSAGARGIFDEKTNIEEISIGIEAVLLNKSYIDIQMIDVIMTSIPNNFSDSGRKLYQSVRVLTAREKQIALLLIQGESNSFIANTLNLANTTVSTHKARIFQKSGVSNIIDLREKFVETDVLDRSIY